MNAESSCDSAALTQRHNLALALLQGDKPYGNKLDPWAVAQRHKQASPESATQFLLKLLVQDDVNLSVRDSLLAAARDGEGDKPTLLRRLAHMMVTLPEYQLA